MKKVNFEPLGIRGKKNFSIWSKNDLLAANLLLSLFHYILLNLVKSIIGNNFFMHADRAFMSQNIVYKVIGSEHFKPIFIFLSCLFLKL